MLLVTDPLTNAMDKTDNITIVVLLAILATIIAYAIWKEKQSKKDRKYNDEQDQKDREYRDKKEKERLEREDRINKEKREFGTRIEEKFDKFEAAMAKGFERFEEGHKEMDGRINGIDKRLTIVEARRHNQPPDPDH